MVRSGNIELKVSRFFVVEVWTQTLLWFVSSLEFILE